MSDNIVKKSSLAGDTLPPPKTEMSPDAPATDLVALRKGDLIDRVVLETGVKKRDAKPVIESLLGILAQSLTSGMTLQLPPLGRVRVARSKEEDGTEVLTLKLRRKSSTAIAAE